MIFQQNLGFKFFIPIVVTNYKNKNQHVTFFFIILTILLGHMWNMLLTCHIELVNPLTKRTLLVIG